MMYTDRDFKLIGYIIVEFLEIDDNLTSTESISQVTDVPRSSRNSLEKIYLTLQEIGWLQIYFLLYFGMSH